jgi:hypothetical protein
MVSALETSANSFSSVSVPALPPAILERNMLLRRRINEVCAAVSSTSAIAAQPAAMETA